MQAFVRLPTEFDNLLLNAAAFFDVSPWSSGLFDIDDTAVAAIKVSVCVGGGGTLGG